MRLIFSLFLLGQAARVNRRTQVESDVALSEKLEDEADVLFGEKLEESADEQIEEVELSNISNVDEEDAEGRRVEIHIGPSYFSRKKCILHDDAHRMTCDTNAGNRGYRLNNDKTRRRRKDYIYEISVEGDEICATRTNKGSWSLRLKIECTLKSVPVYALDGCPKTGDRLKDQTLTDSATAAVRCCSYDIWTSTGHTDSKCVSRLSELRYSLSGCQKSLTYYRARAVCAWRGMRLCSWYELKANTCCGSGCGFDVGTPTWVIAQSYGKGKHDFNANRWPATWRAIIQRTTTTTTVPTHAWPLYALDGCPHKTSWQYPLLKDKRMYEYDSAAVRCCSYHSNQCESRVSGCKTTSFKEAERTCKAAGMRLCSWHEMKTNLCCGTGCGFDLARAWIIPESYGKNPGQFNPNNWHGSGSTHGRQWEWDWH